MQLVHAEWRTYFMPFECQLDVDLLPALREDGTPRAGMLRRLSDEVTAEQLENSEVAGTASILEVRLRTAVCFCPACCAACARALCDAIFLRAAQKDSIATLCSCSGRNEADGAVLHRIRTTTKWI